MSIRVPTICIFLPNSGVLTYKLMQTICRIDFDQDCTWHDFSWMVRGHCEALFYLYSCMPIEEKHKHCKILLLSVQTSSNRPFLLLPIIQPFQWITLLLTGHPA